MTFANIKVTLGSPTCLKGEEDQREILSAAVSISSLDVNISYTLDL